MKKREKNHVYVFRHGQTTYNKKKIFTGHKDAKLTGLGVKQAKRIARKLKDKRLDVAIQTSLSRSKDSLKEVLAYHDECGIVITDDRMIERSYGVISGTKHKTFIARCGKDEFDRIHRGWDEKVEGGESFKDVEKRVKAFVKDLKRLVKKNRVNVVVSAHGNSIRLFNKIMNKSSIEEATSSEIPYDKVFVYEI